MLCDIDTELKVAVVHIFNPYTVLAQAEPGAVPMTERGNSQRATSSQGELVQQAFIPIIRVRIMWKRLQLPTLAGESLRALLTEGWKCDAYGKLCPCESHRGKTHKLLYEPDGVLDAKTIEKECFRYTSLSLHVGDMAPDLVFRKRLTLTKKDRVTGDEKQTFRHPHLTSLLESTSDIS